MNPWVEQEDARKLHAEINQLSGQRTLLCTLAMTLFASIATAVAAYQLTLLVKVVVSSVLIVFILLIAKLAHTLRWVSRCEAIFLEVSALTKWEGPWREFREHRSYSGMKGTETRLFSVLLGLSPFLPVYNILAKRIDTSAWLISIPAVLAAVGILWLLSLERNTVVDEKTAREHWQRILRDKKDSQPG